MVLIFLTRAQIFDIVKTWQDWMRHTLFAQNADNWKVLTNASESYQCGTKERKRGNAQDDMLN